jgi:hypothetical protein
MSTGRPAAPDVASISTSVSSVPAGRLTGTITPVDVSLWAQAITSTSSPPTSDGGVAASPGSASITIGSRRNGAWRVQAANLAENSP